jgi:enoyl-CoA hydratase/carnithine racemase
MKPVLLEREGKIAIVRLNQPTSLNAMSAAVRRGLGEALDAIESSADLRVIVITGSGRAFSAGGDLKEFQTAATAGDYEALARSIEEASAMLTRYENSSLPTMA